jgi:hypothetical protein
MHDILQDTHRPLPRLRPDIVSSWDDPYRQSISDQVERINEYIRQLDRGWVESRMVREFLRRHERG